jgi:hypothetical protein
MSSKKFPIFSNIIIIAAVLLSGCTAASDSSAASSGLSTAYELALGTLKLQGSSNAVTSSQAAQLLTLWEGYASISSSDTTSQVELDALVSQIEAAMTDAQLKAIDDMHLTSQSLAETLSSISSASSPGTPDSSGLSQSSSGGTSSGMPSGGSGSMPAGNAAGMPAGGPAGAAPGGDSSGVGDLLNGVSAQSTQTTSEATVQSQASQVDPILLQALIQQVESISQAAG